MTGRTGARFPGTRAGISLWGRSLHILAGSGREQRKPTLLFVLDGSFLLRLAVRTLFSLLFHEPPRSTPPGFPRLTA
jgi:hypothetical protein